MTALCLYNNISRHIKITSMVLNFVTEICSNFSNNVWILNYVLALGIMIWILNFVAQICNIFPHVENNDFRF